MTDAYHTNAIRCLAIDIVQGANSGHPGAPMGMAPIANLLFSETLKFDPKASHWADRDRFVLSNGHASALLYSMLHLCGYKLPVDELKGFRKWGSITPGHPERHVTEGVEVTTGPLGQGISNAVGMAMAEAHLAATFNKPGFPVVDHHTYVFCGDGCLMEGVAQESLSLAGHLALEKLIVIYDDNFITIDGSTEFAYTEDKEAKYKALKFHTIVVTNGDDDFASMRAALAEAKANKGKPTMILLRTTIGYGAKLQNTAKVHGAPLGAEEITRVKEHFGRDGAKQYHVGDDTYAHFGKQAAAGAAKHAEWTALMAKYKVEHADSAALYERYATGALPEGWQDKLPRNDKPIATRKASENAMAALMPMAPFLIGGSADLTGSNLTRPGTAALVDMQKETPEGRYIRFGVREHGMAAMMNGIDAHGGLIAFGATFLNFIGYAMGAVRLAALSEHGAIYVATHDGIGLGEDGPTHQPVELSALLRATPNLLLLRPSDQTETSAMWAVAMERRKTPSVMALSRQATTPQPGSNFDGAKQGGYVLVSCGCDSPDVILIATGTEVGIAVDAAAVVAAKGKKVRVVSMPSTDLFDEQTAAYRETVLPAGVPALSVEAYVSLGWGKYSHYHCGMDRFGGSAPADVLYKEFGLTPAVVADKAEKLLAHFGGKPAPALAPLQL
jgi:transketolase